MNTPTIIRHPLRNIRLAYDTSKERQPLEEEAIAGYIHLHDEVLRLKQELDRQGKQHEKVKNRMTELQGRLLMLEQETEFFEVGFRLADPEILPEITGTFSFDPADLFDAVSSFQDDFGDFYADVKTCSDDHNKFIKEDEAFDEWFETYHSSLFMNVMHNWEQLSLDIAAFDEDYDNMKSVFPPYTMTKEMFYASSEALLEAYNEFIKVVDQLYRRVERVNRETIKILNKLEGESEE